jgi:protocatechuate 3,4-dioxygenase beta subunit
MEKLRLVLAMFIAGTLLSLAGRSRAETICYKVRPVTVRCVRGTVLDQTGGPFSHATVGILKDGTVLASVQTDEDGRFSFEDIKAGSYDMRAEYPGFIVDEYPIVVKKPASNCKRSLVMVIYVPDEGACPNAHVIKR